MKRRTFIGNSLAGGALLGGTLAPQPVLATHSRKTVTTNKTGKYDILLKGGHVIDPANHINGIIDVAVADGKVSLVGKNIPAREAKKTVDVTGFYVSPGFIDIHCHVFYTDFTTNYRWVIADDMCFPSGVTTIVDPGSSGHKTFEKFKFIIDRSKTRTLALINISDTGMNPDGEQDPSHFSVPPMVELAKKYPDIIVGFKTAHYWTGKPYDKIHTPWASVDATLDAGRKADLPIMIDFFPRIPSEGYSARSYRELILEKGRQGDIHTHVFAIHIPVINKDGKVNEDLFKAQKRGFHLDVGHGAGSFVFRNAVPAIKQGFLPSSISTDLHSQNTCGPVVNMANVMSKFLSMGVPLEDVIRLSTINPAREINRTGLGSLTVGHTADIAVFEVLNGNFDFVDTSGGKFCGDKKLQNLVTLSGGEVVFDPSGFSYPIWEKIQKDQKYWINPSGQYY
ncbi:MAG: amidohydrolase/deacetylase family metallohydrolase [Candidatus Latescibacteria bacterium]|jgi:dihydroorotase|nr:amidohydrolase/deacetylase family metallohydrolase [Candidatus Latescibacterota bacterium]